MMTPRKMRLGLSIRGHGYHPAAWRHPDVPADGTLHGRAVNDKIVPDATKDSAAVRQLLADNLQNTNLLGEEGVFVKDK